MNRREFITLLGGAAAAWPLAARAQQGERVRLLAAMMGGRNADTDLEGRAWFAAFRQGLQELGWVEGRNFRADYRWPSDLEDAMSGRLDRYCAIIDADSTWFAKHRRHRTRSASWASSWTSGLQEECPNSNLVPSAPLLTTSPDTHDRTSRC